MGKLLKQIMECEHCKAFLPLGPRSVVTAGTPARIDIIGRALATKVQKTGIPWDETSGKQLRSWLGVSGEMFYESGL
jgi:uracil-DNA glycosylase